MHEFSKLSPLFCMKEMRSKRHTSFNMNKLVFQSADSEIMMSKSELHSANYHLVSADLRNIATLETKLSASGIDRALPTVFLSECVLVYIEVEATDKLIKWIADSFPTALFINYEQVTINFNCAIQVLYLSGIHFILLPYLCLCVLKKRVVHS